ncbi:Eisosome assembly protein [Ascochyta clinopodiicola]|nr:Eisosome assembly protein [Ascochyta clinopodiicola]
MPGAAASLKYAKASDLPSFPVVGIDTSSSAGAAALLANQNKKSPEWWKPEQSSAAGKAALLANDYKMKPLWQPEASAAGSKAALLAHRDGVKLNLWQPQASADGNSAANIAMRKTGLGPQIDYGYTEDGRKRALVAATGAHSAAGRKRAQSIPMSVPLYPDSKNSAKNALNAATIAHSPSMRASKTPAAQPQDSNRLGSGAMEAARIQHAKSAREMYTSAPPVALEVEEKKRNDALRASAIVMAKKMYDIQQQHIEGASGRSGTSAARTGATAAHGQQPASSEGDIKQQAMQYIGIQEAAQKLAQERLAKIGYDENAAYRSYYGYEKQSRSKLSMRRGRPRARSTSEAPPQDSDSDEDDFRSRRIRNQMKQFNEQLADVDAKKRDQDRKGLIAAAERKVQAQMQGLDKDVYNKTGKMSNSMMEDWDEKARQRALANSEARMENHGRVMIGNGKWMDQAEIDAIAQARLQPTFDEITEKAEKRRADDAERQFELEKKQRKEQEEKARLAEIKSEERKGKDEEKRAAKARNAEEKAAAKQAKEAEKTRKAEEDRLVKGEQRKSKEASRAAPTAVPALGTTVVATPTAAATDRNDDLYEEPTAPTGLSNLTVPTHGSAVTAPASTDPTSPTSPNSSKGIKSIFNKLKRRSKHDSAVPNDVDSKTTEKDNTGFIGGASLRASESKSHSSTTPSTPHAEASSSARPTDLGDVEPTVVPHVKDDRYSDISSLSSDDEELNRGRPRPGRLLSDDTRASSDFEEARDHFDQDLAPPPTFTSEVDKGRLSSPVRDSKFHEVGI